MLVISNRTLPAHSSGFKITCMISDQLHSTAYPFSFIVGFHSHASKNKNKTINSRIWEMKWGWYRKTLAKIQVSMIFHTRNILRNCLPKIIERFLRRRHVGAHPNGHQPVPVGSGGVAPLLQKSNFCEPKRPNSFCNVNRRDVDRLSNNDQLFRFRTLTSCYAMLCYALLYLSLLLKLINNS